MLSLVNLIFSSSGHAHHEYVVYASVPLCTMRDTRVYSESSMLTSGRSTDVCGAELFNATRDDNKNDIYAELYSKDGV